jgi:SAM-dependent methyltransferase
VAIDSAARKDSPYFTRYKESRGLQDSLSTYWETDQADKERLREIVEMEFAGPLDLVIDDCSHLYPLTKASFEALYPLLRPGGLYIVEDWAWAHWSDFQSPSHEWATETPLTRLVFDLIEAVGTSPDFISSLVVYEGFVVLERGPDPSINPDGLSLDKRIRRRKVDAASLARSRHAKVLSNPLRHPLSSAKMAGLQTMKRFPRMRRSKTVHLEAIHAKASGMSDEEWLGMLIKSLKNPVVRGLVMPPFPEAALQEGMVGSAGEPSLREAFSFYREIKGYQDAYGSVELASSHVLDFGCGWGRHLRFFLKDAPVENLHGIDVDPEFIEVSRRSLPNLHLEVVQPLPPTNFGDDSLDLVYAYSVFSHLAEHAHQSWIAEFHRILRPGGLLVLTTQRRAFIDYCESLRNGQPEGPWQTALASSFVDVDATKQAYDEGAFLYAATGGGSVRDASFYGEAIVSSDYIRRTWADRFEVLDFVDDESRSQQAIVVARNGATC